VRSSKRRLATHTAILFHYAFDAVAPKRAEVTAKWKSVLWRNCLSLMTAFVARGHVMRHWRHKHSEMLAPRRCGVPARSIRENPKSSWPNTQRGCKITQDSYIARWPLAPDVELPEIAVTFAGLCGRGTWSARERGRADCAARSSWRACRFGIDGAAIRSNLGRCR